MVSKPALTNPQSADGCFNGWRIVNEDRGLLARSVDLVPAILTPTQYEHAKMPAMRVDKKFRTRTYPCGGGGWDWEVPSLVLHFWWNYYAVEVVPGIETLTTVGLRSSYNSNVYDVMQKVAPHGFIVAGSAQFDVFLGTQVSYLFRHRATNACILTFQGSDSPQDFMDDALVWREPFCGLKEEVHYGFKKALVEMVSSNSWQQQVRPNLQYCKGVDVVGHSLGGAMAAMFAACSGNTVEKGQKGYDEWKWMHWTNA